MHFCSHCGHEIPHREKFCQNCGTKIEYLCSLPPLPTEPSRRREIRSAASITRWIVAYIVAVILTFGISYLYFSSPDSFGWLWSFSKPASVVSESVPVSPAVRNENPTAALKNAYNQLSVVIQKTSLLVEDSRKVNVPGDPKRTAANYRSVQQKCESLLSQLSIPPDSAPEIAAVAVPLKESLSLLSKSTSTMSDYLEGKLSLAPPNPDWVGRSQEYSAQAQARLNEAQQAQTKLRKKIE